MDLFCSIICWNVFTEPLPSNVLSKSVTILMITSMDSHKNTQKYNLITNSAFHRKLPYDNPVLHMGRWEVWEIWCGPVHLWVLKKLSHKGEIHLYDAGWGWNLYIYQANKKKRYVHWIFVYNFSTHLLYIICRICSKHICSKSTGSWMSYAEWHKSCTFFCSLRY
jgi:hypothetical protein